jgi:hypothetical protein
VSFVSSSWIGALGSVSAGSVEILALVRWWFVWFSYSELLNAIRCSGIFFLLAGAVFFWFWLGVAGFAFCFLCSRGVGFGAFWWAFVSSVLVLLWGVPLVLFVVTS